MNGDLEVVDAELVDEPTAGQPAALEQPQPRYLVDQHTVLRPGEMPPTTADRPAWGKHDFRISEETAKALDEAPPQNTLDARATAMRAFTKWCAAQKPPRVALPCTTATFTEYARHLMDKGHKVNTIKAYMSNIRVQQPIGYKPDDSLYLSLLGGYRRENKRAVRTRKAFPIRLPYLLPMLKVCDADGRPKAVRDAALLAFGYRFLGRRIEAADLEIEDLVITDTAITVWLAKDKSHQDEDQTLVLHDRPDIQLVARMRRWLAHLEAQGVTTGPLFRALTVSGTLAGRAHATRRGEALRGHAVNEIVQARFKEAGLSSNGFPVTAHGLRRGGSQDLADSGATAEEIEAAGRWSKGSPTPGKEYLRPLQAAAHDPFARVPIGGVRDVTQT